MDANQREYYLREQMKAIQKMFLDHIEYLYLRLDSNLKFLQLMKMEAHDH